MPMTISRRLRFALAGFVALITIGYLLTPHLITDREMVDFFHQHETDFKTLAEMLSADQRVKATNRDQIQVNDPKYPSFSYLWASPSEVDFSSQRFSEYQRLLKNIHAVVDKDENGDLQFGTGGYGFASYGARWGYFWCKNPPNKEFLTDSIDHRSHASEDRDTNHFRLRPLGGNWYCFLF